MAGSGAPKDTSALRRGGGAPARRRDPDQTDPAAELLADEFEEETSAAVPGDKTQLYDASAHAAPDGRTFKLLVVAGPKAGAEFALEAEVTVGRSADNPVSIPDVSVSRKHVKIAPSDEGVIVTDLGSGNGTLLNDARISTATAQHGDEIVIGDTVLQVVEVGAPAVKKRARKDGPTPAPAADTKAPTSLQVAKVAPAPTAAPAPAAKPGGIPPARKRLYLIASGLCVLLLLAGAVRMGRAKRLAAESASAGEVVDAGALFKEAKSLAFQHQWSAAVEKAKEAAEYADDAAIAAFLEQAQAEAKYEATLNQAKKKLDSGALAEGKKLLGAVPRDADVYPQVRELSATIPSKLDAALASAQELASSDKERAKAAVAGILEVDPEHSGALALRTELEKKVASPAKKVVTVKAEEPEPTKAIVPPKQGFDGPAVSAYLAGDLQRALRLAEDGDDAPLLKQLRMFDAAYREGMEQAKNQRAPEAVKALGVAAKSDKIIAGSRQSKPGKEVSHQLATMEYLLGIDCRGDDNLPCSSKHFQAALAAEPGHALAKKQFEKVVARAKEIFTEAYILKGNDTDRAKKLFKIVRDSLPPDDETHQKAARWLDNLGG